MKKYLVIACLMLVLLGFLGIASAELEIVKTAVSDVVVTELGNQAEFNILIKNSGPSDNFQVYTLVSGITLTPEDSFYISKDGEKEINVKISFDEKMLKGRESFGFEYRIAGDKSGVTKDILSVRVFSLGSAVTVTSKDIQFNQKEATLVVKNRANYTFQDISINAKSEFFNKNYQLSLGAYEEKSFAAELDQDRLGRAIGGEYLLSYTVSKGIASGKGTSIFSFRELTNIKTEEKTSGILTRTFTSNKINIGNSKAFVRIFVEKGWFTKLFTSTNIEPSDIEKQNGKTILVFEKELMPDETFTVIVKTRYWIPLLLLIALGAAAWMIFVEGRKCISVKKKVVFVKTKGGEFALRIVLYVRALKNIQKVSITERIPGIVKIFKKFGLIEPTNIDEKKRIVEWKFDSMNAGEERVVSYIVYSKIGIFGKFELAPAIAIYDCNGQVYEEESNRVVFTCEEKKACRNEKE